MLQLHPIQAGAHRILSRGQMFLNLSTLAVGDRLEK